MNAWHAFDVLLCGLLFFDLLRGDVLARRVDRLEGRRR